MQTLTSPFRFAGQWASLPILVGAALITGGMLGVLDVWATSDHASVELWVLELLRSPLLVIVATAMIGMATNWWTIAIITGALTLLTAAFATDAARWYWSDHYSLMADDLPARLPLALLAGGALGLGGCVWHHEAGYTRSIGAAMLAGSLAWLSWRDLAADGWPLDMVHLAGWVAGVLGLLILGRCREFGPIVIAAIGAVIVALGINFTHAEPGFDLQSTLTTLHERWNQLTDRVRSGD
ncbi:MAG TPA: hypothetical protein VEW66_09430 [Thermomicrobiales bacterium]|nr:hypothetical protein [Thermomicrobiales bacterium]